MLGSHNSLSYLPTKGWRKILTPWVRCQSLTIEEQYEKGVRYFDLRVKIVDGKGWCFCHNNAIFSTVMEHKEIIDFLSEKKANVRIMLDVRKTPDESEGYKNTFFDFVDWMKENGVKVDSVIVYWEWKGYGTNSIKQHEYHTSVSAPWYKYILGTKWFAKHYNKKYLEENKDIVNGDNDVALIDYIQFG